jgi:hypothetical protein
MNRSSLDQATHDVADGFPVVWQQREADPNQEASDKRADDDPAQNKTFPRM